MVQGRSGCGYGGYWRGALVGIGDNVSRLSSHDPRAKCEMQTHGQISRIGTRLLYQNVLLHGHSRITVWSLYGRASNFHPQQCTYEIFATSVDADYGCFFRRNYFSELKGKRKYLHCGLLLNSMSHWTRGSSNTRVS